MKTLFEFKWRSDALLLGENFQFKLGLYDVEIKVNGPQSIEGDLTILSPGEFTRVPLEIKETLVYIEDFMEYIHGHFKLSIGMEVMTNIPENDEEKERLGDTPHSVVMHFLETSNRIGIEKELVRNIESFLPALKYISLFNSAEKSNSQIYKFLNYFKVIEDRFYSGRRKLKDTLKAQPTLIKYLNEITLTKSDPNNPSNNKKYKLKNVSETIGEFVDLRNECVHLRSKNKFGFAENDLNALKRLNQSRDILKELARRIIEELLAKLYAERQINNEGN